jgi:O-antigen/teichoic acid export membrane protein
MSVVAKRLAANVVMSWTANIVKVGIQIMMLPLMARLLGPEEMGLYSLALPILGFVILLSDGGLGNSLARESRENDLVWSSAFWGLLATCSALAVIVVIISYFVGLLSHQPRLITIMIPLSLTLLLVASSVVPAARLLQSGRQGLGSIADMIGNMVGAGLGIWIALSGGGVWAMVAQYLCRSFSLVSPP